MKKSTLSILIFLALTGCKADEELLSGDISGKISVYNDQHVPVSDMQGVTVELYQQGEIIRSTSTHSDGKYVFVNIPYGRYEIDFYKENFIRQWSIPPVFHVGGKANTVLDLNIEEIPRYQVLIDSAVIFSDYEIYDYSLKIFLKFNGDTILPDNSNYYRFMAYFSNSPEVSKDNYKCIARGYIIDFGRNYEDVIAAYGVIPVYNIENFNELDPVNIFLVLYPMATNQGTLVDEFFPEALGEASNVISFNWDDL